MKCFSFFFASGNSFHSCFLTHCSTMLIDTAYTVLILIVTDSPFFFKKKLRNMSQDARDDVLTGDELGCLNKELGYQPPKGLRRQYYRAIFLVSAPSIETSATLN